MAGSGCISDPDLQAFVRGELPESLTEVVARHLELCPDCEDRASRWDNVSDTAVQALRGAGQERTLEKRSDGVQGTNPTASDTPVERVLTISSPDGYTVLDKLGQGGMGVVFQARQHNPERVVALKFFAGGVHAAEERARFLAEANVIARLDHPNIVQVHAVGEHLDRPFLCLEYLEGGHLGKKIAGQPQPPRQAAHLLKQLAHAVQHAHEKGIIHRDLKPANVLLTADGTPKVTDFGLARFGRPELTATGAVLGTPAYMAPEQARGEAKQVGPAADIWALGVILYELLTGQPPFRGVQVLDTLQQVVEREPVAPRQLQPKVPRDLETICLKCLHKQSSRRYPSAAELTSDLQHFLAGLPISARPLGVLERASRWSRRNPALATAGLLTLAFFVLTVAASIGFGVYQYQVATSLDAARQKADLLVLQSGIARATDLCQQGDVAQGLLWWADSLERAEDLKAADAERLIRSNLGSWAQRWHTLRACLEHTHTITAVALAPSGRLAATAGTDGTVQLWQTPAGAKVGKPLPHAGPVTQVLFGPDSKMLLTVSGRAAFFWDAATGSRLDSLCLELKETITAVAFDPHGTAVLAGGADGSLRLLELTSGHTRDFLHRHKGPIHAATFSADGRLALSGGGDSTGRLWHTDSGQPAAEPLRHAEAVRAVAFRPDGQAVATGSSDATAQVWQVATGAKLGPPLRHNARVTALAFGPDDKTLATASAGWNAYLWDADTGTLRATLKHLGPVHSLQLSGDGKTLVTGSLDGTVRLWDTASGKPAAAPLTHPGELRWVAFSPDGRWILTAGAGPAARLWQRAAPPETETRLHYPGWTFALAFSATGCYLATPGEDHGVPVWEVATQRRVCHLPHPGLVRAVAFRPDEEIIATGGEDRQIRLWRVADGRPSGAALDHPAEVSAAAFAPDGRTLLTGTIAGMLTLWEVATGRRLQQLARHEGPIWSAAFSADGRWFITAGADHTARIGEAATTRPVATLRHQGQVWSAAFSPDGTAVVTASGDQTVRQWQTVTGRPLGAPLRTGGPVRSVAFSPDGQALVVGSWEGTARLWEAASRKPLGAPLGHASGPVLAARFIDGGKTIIGATEDKTLLRWPTPAPFAGTAQRAAYWAQVSTGLALDSDGGIQVLTIADWQERRQALQKLGGATLP
jgi:WD40 repeat protein